MDPLRFGKAEAPDTRRVLPGVVAGIGGYGNCLGLPNIGGEIVFDETYAGNPLVNALVCRRHAPRKISSWHRPMVPVTWLFSSEQRLVAMVSAAHQSSPLKLSILQSQRSALQFRLEIHLPEKVLDRVFARDLR
jgi:hypothetical protein